MGPVGQMQSRVAVWHESRFPSCTAEDVVLKALTELGEVADAVLASGRDASHPERAASLTAEAADVMITMFALVGRFGSGTDLLSATRAKLAILETPGGPHPGCLPAKGS